MDADGIVEGGRRQDLFRRLILPHHVDGAAAGGGAHARMIGVRRRDRRGAGQREPERFGDRHHGRRGAHHHAGAERARNAAFDLVPLVVADAPGALLVPVFPGVRAGTEGVAAPIAAQHRTGRHIDRRNAHRNRAHDQARRGLVAAAHQNRAVDRMAAQQFLAFHGEKIAIEHGRRLDERFGERHRRQLDRKPAGLIDAAFDVLGAVAQMPVAGVDLAPGIDDADHRLADPIGAVIAELAQARAMTERPQIVLAEPAELRSSSGDFLLATPDLPVGGRTPRHDDGGTTAFASPDGKALAASGEAAAVLTGRGPSRLCRQASTGRSTAQYKIAARIIVRAKITKPRPTPTCMANKLSTAQIRG